jgi:hypothetical protein
MTSRLGARVLGCPDYQVPNPYSRTPIISFSIPFSPTDPYSQHMVCSLIFEKMVGMFELKYVEITHQGRIF